MQSTTNASENIFLERTRKILPYAVKAEPEPEVCPHCNGEGYLFSRKEYGLPKVTPCECTRRKQELQRLKNSGIPQTLALQCTFDSFVPTSPQTEKMKRIALGFAENPEGWLFLAGQRGCGKTHLAVATAARLVERGYQVRYMSWRREIAGLKRQGGLPEEREQRVRELQKCPVLLLEDLLQATQVPTPADLDLASEILDERYNNGLPTILTTPWTHRQIAGFSAHLADRIFERSQNSRAIIPEDNAFNYRLRNPRRPSIQ